MDTIDLILILLVTYSISVLTLMTGFGIGTVLTPTFALFYDVKTAVFLAAIVHLANNYLKFGLFRKHLDISIFKRFGLISILGALVGSLLQGYLDTQIVKMTLALALVVIAVSEFLPPSLTVQLPRKYDYAGGLFSGFLGGIVGNQGAIRSAYLLSYKLNKEVFVATATAISLVIDLTRVPIYIYHQYDQLFLSAVNLLVIISVAFMGTLTGKELLKKVSLERFRFLVASFVIVAAIAMFI